MGRDRQQETRDTWFKAGHWLPRRDDALRTGNMGLGSRERRALSEENSRPWGQSIFATRAVTDRAHAAQKQARAKARGKGKAKGKGWFD